jgi:hypothetical protein
MPAFRLSGKTQGTVVRVELTDRDVLGVEVGRPARVRLDAAPERAIVAHVSRVASAASPLSGGFQVDVHLDDAGPQTAFTGLTAKVVIERTAHPGSLVPVAAIVPGDDATSYVVAVESGRARKVPVHVLFLEGERVAIAETLDGLTAIATEGGLSVADGVYVTQVP